MLFEFWSASEFSVLSAGNRFFLDYFVEEFFIFSAFVLVHLESAPNVIRNTGELLRYLIGHIIGYVNFDFHCMSFRLLSG